MRSVFCPFQLDKQKHANKGLELNSATNRSRLAEAETLREKSETECSQLRRDKLLLVDHVADLQKQASRSSSAHHDVTRHKQ